MKKLLIILSVVVISISCKTGNTGTKSDLEASNLKGQVWKVEKVVHNAMGKTVCPAAEKAECNNSVFVYGKNGYLIESSEIDEDGKVSESSKYLYGGSDLCKGIEKYAANVLKGKEINTYKNGKLTEVRVFNEQGETESILTYEYSGSELTGGKVFNKAGELISSFRNEYSNGRLIKQTSLDKSGSPSSVTSFIRNEKNDVIEYHVLTPQDNNEFKVINEFEYDNQGNWIKKTQKYDGQIVGIVMRNITYYNS